MRNPLDRIESHYNHGQIEKWKAANFAWNRERISDELICFSSYAKQISEYYMRFPQNRIKLLLLEELMENKLGTLKDICKFLNVDSRFEFQKTDRTYNRSCDRITNSFLNKLNRSRMVRRMAFLLPYKVKRGAKSFMIKKGAENYKLSPEMREQTLKKLEPDLKVLRDEYNVNISRWGIDI